MNKLYTPVVLLIFSLLTSCNVMLNTSSLHPEEVKSDVEVIRIHTNDAGLVHFSKKFPGHIINDEITGVVQVPLELFRSDSIIYRLQGGKERPLFVYSDGIKLDVFRIEKMNLVYTSTLIRVPLKEVILLEMKKDSRQMIVLSGLIVGISGFCVYVISNMSFQFGNKF